MSVSYDWIVERLDCYPESQGEKNVVTCIYWRCIGMEVFEEKPYSSSSYGTVAVNYSEGDDFISYELLTKDDVLGWVWGTVDKEAIEGSIAQTIAAQINPPIVNPPLPWNG